MGVELKNIKNDGIIKFQAIDISEKKIEEMICQALDEIMKKESFIVKYLTNLKDAHNYTAMHCIQVSVLSGIIGIKTGLAGKNLTEVMKAGLVHDYGKAYIPVRLLDKTDKLTANEFEIIKLHPEIGYDKLKEKHCFSKEMLTVVLQHHEKLDGSGYPFGLKNGISPYSQIVSIADVYDALTSDRAYRNKYSNKKALDTILLENEKYNTDLVHILADYLNL